jgi:hypothetical protein
LAKIVVGIAAELQSLTQTFAILVIRNETRIEQVIAPKRETATFLNTLRG